MKIALRIDEKASPEENYVHLMKVSVLGIVSLFLLLTYFLIPKRCIQRVSLNLSSSQLKVITIIGLFKDLHVPLRKRWSVYWNLSLFEHLHSSKVSSMYFHGNDNINRFRLRWHGISAVVCCSFDADDDGCWKSLVLNALLMSNRILIVSISSYISTSINRAYCVTKRDRD